MPDLDTWLSYGKEYAHSEENLSPIRAILAWGRINAKPTEVRFKTSSGTLGPQTVRLESNNTATSMESVSGTAPRRGVVIFGIRDHPTLPDTDIDEGYTFFHEGDILVVKDVIITLGEIQGISEAIR